MTSQNRLHLKDGIRWQMQTPAMQYGLWRFRLETFLEAYSADKDRVQVKYGSGVMRQLRRFAVNLGLEDKWQYI